MWRSFLQVLGSPLMSLGLVWWEPKRLEHLGRVHGTASQLTRVMQDLFVGTEGGLLHLFGSDERLYTTSDGLPSNTLTSLIPGPSEKSLGQEPTVV